MGLLLFGGRCRTFNDEFNQAVKRAGTLLAPAGINGSSGCSTLLKDRRNGPKVEEPNSSLKVSLVKSPDLGSTAGLLWHCFPGGEGAFCGCDVVGWEPKDIGSFQLIVHEIDGHCRNEPRGLGWSKLLLLTSNHRGSK